MIVARFDTILDLSEHRIPSYLYIITDTQTISFSDSGINCTFFCTLQLVHVTEGFPLVNVLMVMGGASVLITTVDLIVLSVMRDFMDSPIANVS